ncbi:MAG: hypothetical protein IT567_02815, partial [Alphaproteobacteria bacterium]|nr:hypothetical protein [Alphaproteobacteria bacterium]
MAKSSSGSHTTVCTCAACTGTQTKSDFMTKSGDSSAINDYHYDAKSGMLVSAQGFAINTKTAAGYVQALFGKDSAVWSDGGAGTAAFGQSATVTYSFQDVSWGNYYHWGNSAALDSAQVTAARAAMTMWSNVSNIKFVEGTATTAKIAFHEYNLPAGAGVAVASSYNDDAKGAGDRLAQVEVCVDDSTTGFSAGGYGYLTFIHEVGHAIGLKH